MTQQKANFRGIVQSLGLVFGDIGTSPIYTLTVVFLLTERTVPNVIGVLSLIVWTMITLVTIKYAWLAMGLGRRGEGGIIVMTEILLPYLTTGRQAAFVTLISYVGISLFVGDGVITPAISILSAVEGLLLIPVLSGTSQAVLIAIAAVIAIALFSVQKKGTEKVSGAFGPIMLVWFAILALSGIASIIQMPIVLNAISPVPGIRFLCQNVTTGFFVLAEVILCATGGEALYADMGHLGGVPIRRAWNFVFPALLLSYLGQGAFLASHPDVKNVLFEMLFYQAPAFYIPFLLLSIAATIIASQAMISGMYSLVFQGIMTRIMPILKVDFTSHERQTQIYIGAVNWSLLLAVLFIIFEFQTSARLAVAYGLAVTGTMAITGSMMVWIFLKRQDSVKAAVSALVTLIATVYLLSNTTKIPHGGYWSLVIASIPFGIIMLYTRGQRKLYYSLQPLPMDVFLLSYNQIFSAVPKIRGTALFFAKDAQAVPPYIVHTMFKNHIIYEDNIIVSIVRREDPFGVTGFFKEDIAPGLRAFEIQMGYMEIPDVEEILREAGISEKTIFYGVEDIVASNILWQAFSVIKKLTPNIVQFFKLPANKLHGVVTRVEM
ncbi:MAG: KUP/HAK/KT family potassium transporter [Nitrospirota bacterium]|nr:KUP/HAK/KT family potassium transporter [Nitrospirota bacterium]